MSTVTLTSTGTWTVPSDCPVGTAIKVEAWGPGSGASTGAAQGGAGAGGAYATSPAYIVTPDNIVNGVPFVIPVGGVGTIASTTAPPGDTTWSTNNLNVVPSTTNVGAVVGTPGTLPGTVHYNVTSGLSTSVVGFGTDLTTGLSYFDVRWFGTIAGTSVELELALLDAVVSAATQYTLSVYCSVVAGALPAGSSFALNGSTFTSGGAGLTTPFSSVFAPGANAGALGSSRGTATATTDATAGLVQPYLVCFSITNGAAVDVTLRVAGIQGNLGASATAWMSTPGYTLAKGAAGKTGTTAGAIGGAAASCIPATGAFSGGDGAAFNAAGSGGGGSAGKDGAGNAGTAAGVGGQGDNTTGGLGGAVKTTTPGNPGTANPEGGGGGGALTTASSGVGGVGGAPGGGGGNATNAAVTGGSGARGQIRLTYTPFFYMEWFKPMGEVTARRYDVVAY